MYAARAALTTDTRTKIGPVSPRELQDTSRSLLGFTAKLMIMVAVPLAALILLLGLEIADHLDRQRDTHSLVVGSELIVDTERLVNAFQAERASWSFSLSTANSLDEREFVGQWDETDVALASFKSTLTRFSAAQEGQFIMLEYSNLLGNLEQLDTMRQEILDLDVTWSESLVFYSDLIGGLLSLSGEVGSLAHTDQQIRAIFHGFFHLSETLEAADVERALIFRVLTNAGITHDEIGLLGRLAILQETALRSYSLHVPYDIRSQYQTYLTAAETSQVPAFRQEIMYASFERFDPVEWIEIASARIDAISTAEQGFLADLTRISTAMADEERSEILRFSAFSVFVLMTSLLVAERVGRRLSMRTNELARVAASIAEGDLSQRAEIGARDELGTLAFAFNRMTDDLTTLNHSLENQVEARTAQLGVSEARSRAMLEALPNLIIRLDGNGVYVDVKTPSESGVFLPQEQFIGKHITEILPREVAQEFMSASRRAHQTHEMQHMEYQFLIYDQLREREASVVAIPGSDQTILVIRDITEQKADKQDLQKLIHSKDELIASISHELRTPLTAVIGFAELLHEAESGLSPTEQAELIESITDHSYDISDIIEDLLVAARAEIDTLYVARVPVDLHAELAQVLKVSREASEHQIEIVGGPVTAMGDPGRVRQILRNLLTNASRYGGDRVQVRMHSNGTSAFLQVCDDGPGVPGQDRESIFEPYQQSHTTPGQPGSVGLGLSVSRSLAQLMGGDLTYDYRDGVSIFEVTLTASDQSSAPV